MSWPAAAYGLLGVALLVGFAWYERSRPDSRVVALVGTLAALAALGRIAFAAVPNVKPTTDIVLVAGYALGGAPGFVVGAVAALTSNFFFGQGPWTPWQMAGWGATGVIGAGLAQLTRGRIGRWPLAAVCFVVGFGFTAVQDAGDWVTYSDHSLGALGLFLGRGVGFDLVHAVGCVVFALAFGPALIGALRRFRARLEVTWVAPALVAAAALGALHVTGAATAATAAAGVGPLGYLEDSQNADGGFGAGPGSASSSLFSGWAALGLAAGGVDPARLSRGGPTLLAYLERHPGRDPGSLERSILAIRAGGGRVSRYVGALRRDLRSDGSVGEQTNLTAFAVLALRAAGLPPPRATIAWLEHQQDGDGGFNFATAGRGATSDPDDTGAVLEAVGARAPGRVVGRAVRFLLSQENDDGGFPSQPGANSNAQSTAFAVQGLIAVGAARHNVARAQAYLRSLIAPDGHVAYARGQTQTPVWVTAQAEAALVGRPLPLPSPSPAAVAVPVARRPPARRARAHAMGHGAIAHTASRRRGVRKLRTRRKAAAPPLNPLVRGVGIAAALALAPVENP